MHLPVCPKSPMGDSIGLRFGGKIIAEHSIIFILMKPFSDLSFLIRIHLHFSSLLMGFAYFFLLYVGKRAMTN